MRTPCLGDTQRPAHQMSIPRFPVLDHSPGFHEAVRRRRPQAFTWGPPVSTGAQWVQGGRQHPEGSVSVGWGLLATLTWGTLKTPDGLATAQTNPISTLGKQGACISVFKSPRASLGRQDLDAVDGGRGGWPGWEHTEPGSQLTTPR